MTAAIAATFALMAAAFTPSADGATAARADVYVIEAGLTAEACRAKLAEADPDPYGPHAVLFCTLEGPAK